MKAAALLRGARVPLVLVALLVLHTAVMPDVSIRGVHPDVLVLAAVAGGLSGGPERGAVLGFVAGLLGGLFEAAPLGLSALVLSLVGYGVGSLQTSMLRQAWWITPATAAVAAAGAAILHALAGAMVGQAHLVQPALLGVALVAGVFGALLAPVVVTLVRWAVAPFDEVERVYGR